MSAHPINLQAIHQALAKLDKLLEDYPELAAPNPERWEAFEEWLHTLAQEEPHDATEANRETTRKTQK